MAAEKATYTELRCETCGVLARLQATLPAPMDVAMKISNMIGDETAVMDTSLPSHIMGAVRGDHVDGCPEAPADPQALKHPWKK